MAGNCIRILDIEQDSVTHEVMLTDTIQTERRTDYFQVPFAIPIPKHQTVACVLARRFFGLALFDIKTGCLQKFRDMRSYDADFGSYDPDLKTAHVPHDSLIMAGGMCNMSHCKGLRLFTDDASHLLPTLISR